MRRPQRVDRWAREEKPNTTMNECFYKASRQGPLELRTSERGFGRSPSSERDWAQLERALSTPEYHLGRTIQAARVAGLQKGELRHTQLGRRSPELARDNAVAATLLRSLVRTK